jgi:glucuronate isomerase
MVAEHRMDLIEAHELITDLTYNLPKKAYKLDGTKRQDGASA